MAREIVLDTETTGFDPKTGDRMVEVGLIEIEDLLPTGRTFHKLIHPDRLIPDEVVKVHGITNEKVKDAPKFRDLADDMLAFIGDAPVIAHNAAFDRSFINFELELNGRPPIPLERWIDTLALAQQRFPGMSNSLDSLCKRYKVSLVERTLHGALIDARLLASVYLELKGGKERGLALDPYADGSAVRAPRRVYGARPQPLPSRLDAETLAIHAAFVHDELGGEKSVWRKIEPEAAA